jgi:hypothetical protein
VYALRSTSRATAVSASMTTAGAACSAVKENNARYLGGECHYGSRAQSASQSARDTLEATLVTAATARCAAAIFHVMYSTTDDTKHQQISRAKQSARRNSSRQTSRRRPK